MISCEVTEDRIGNLTVSFDNGGKSLFLQTDYSRATFGVACGAIKAARDWDGDPDKLPDKWWEIDWENITCCPYEYCEAGY